MKQIITQTCYNNLLNQLHELRYIKQPELSKHIEECRSIGSLDDNPEYYQSLEDMDRLNKKINELSSIMSNCAIFDKTMIKEDTVMFGATVEYQNTDTEQLYSYTLTSIYESDIANKKISIEAPLVQEMLGLHTDDFFYFNENEYVITNICFSCEE